MPTLFIWIFGLLRFFYKTSENIIPATIILYNFSYFSYNNIPFLIHTIAFLFHLTKQKQRELTSRCLKVLGLTSCYYDKWVHAATNVNINHLYKVADFKNGQVFLDRLYKRIMLFYKYMYFGLCMTQQFHYYNANIVNSY